MLSDFSRFKEPLSKDHESGAAYNESIRHLDIRSGEDIGVSPLTGKKVEPFNNSAPHRNLLHYNC